MVVSEPRPRHPSSSSNQCEAFKHHKRRLHPPPRLHSLIPILSILVLGLAFPGIGSSQEGPSSTLKIKGTSEALVVETEARCSEVTFRSPEVVVRWSIDPAKGPGTPEMDALLAASDYRIDFSKFPRGLDSDRFESLEIAASDARLDGLRESTSEGLEFASVARDLAPGVRYDLRVMAKTPDGWVTGRPASFISSVCPVDGLQE